MSTITATLGACEPLYTIQVCVLNPDDKTHHWWDLEDTWHWLDLANPLEVTGVHFRMSSEQALAQAKELRKKQVLLAPTRRKGVRVLDEHKRILWESSET